MPVERSRPAPVLDLARPTAVDVEIDVSEAAEVLMSICAVGDRDDHETFDLGGELLRATYDTLPPDLVATVDGLSLGSSKLAGHLLGIVLETPKPRTFAAFLDRLAATDPVEIKLHLFGAYGSSFSHVAGPDVIERAVRGDAEATQTFLGSFAEYTEKHESARRLLELGADEVKARLLDLLPRWHELVFRPHEREWREAAERDAEMKVELARTRSPEQLAELATRGYQYAPAPGIRRIVFFASWWTRPWVILWEHKGAKIFCHPIAALPDESASSTEVARVYKALGDEGRLRLLRRLSEGPLKLSDAAAELGVAKSTAHHHLAILRQAGFVTIRDEDENVYSLRPDPPAAGELLGTYLGSPPSSASKSSATRA